MESYPLSYVILTDPFDSYTAGERHGRDYRYSKILENCEGLGIVRSVRSKKIKATIENIYSELRSRVLCMMDGNIETQSTLHLLDPSGVILKSDNLRMITRIDAIKTLSSLVASFLFETNIS
jgi:filamentous hemagglutinin family protein